MEILRTPDERFAPIAGFPYEPAYAEVRAGDGPPLRMAHVDVGPPAPGRSCCCTASRPGRTCTAT